MDERLGGAAVFDERAVGGQAGGYDGGAGFDDGPDCYFA